MTLSGYTIPEFQGCIFIFDGLGACFMGHVFFWPTWYMRHGIVSETKMLKRIRLIQLYKHELMVWYRWNKHVLLITIRRLSWPMVQVVSYAVLLSKMQFDQAYFYIFCKRISYHVMSWWHTQEKIILSKIMFMAGLCVILLA